MLNPFSDSTREKPVLGTSVDLENPRNYPFGFASLILAHIQPQSFLRKLLGILAKHTSSSDAFFNQLNRSAAAAVLLRFEASASTFSAGLPPHPASGTPQPR